jgi:hypothetical protein
MVAQAPQLEHILEFQAVKVALGVIQYLEL